MAAPPFRLGTVRCTPATTGQVTFASQSIPWTSSQFQSIPAFEGESQLALPPRACSEPFSNPPPPSWVRGHVCARHRLVGVSIALVRETSLVMF